MRCMWQALWWFAFVCLGGGCIELVGLCRALDVNALRCDCSAMSGTYWVGEAMYSIYS